MKIFRKQKELGKTIRSTIEGLLNQLGIPVGVLTELEKRKGIHGLFDPKSLKDVAKGVSRLIRVAQGTRGDFALGKEYGHFDSQFKYFNI